MASESGHQELMAEDEPDGASHLKPMSQDYQDANLFYDDDTSVQHAQQQHKARPQ